MTGGGGDARSVLARPVGRKTERRSWRSVSGSFATMCTPPVRAAPCWNTAESSPTTHTSKGTSDFWAEKKMFMSGR